MLLSLMMIAIIDYGMGNLRSVQKGFECVGHDAVITDNPEIIEDASSIVLPGVGAFRDAISQLENLGLIEPILSSIKSGKPYLGICLGLHLLFSSSEEFGKTPGLDIIKGEVKRFTHPGLKIPHMGWNQIRLKVKGEELKVLKEIPDGTYFYFVHSYYVVPEDESVIATTTHYGIEFTSMIWKDNIYATQFHPEKSQKAGLSILKAFGEIGAE
jgi:glutamine amidotransferase